VRRPGANAGQLSEAADDVLLGIIETHDAVAHRTS
jgi:hypothetical protein